MFPQRRVLNTKYYVYNESGIDHLYAVKTINEVHKAGGKVCRIDSIKISRFVLYIWSSIEYHHF